ncbi:MAG: hypothetical protein FWC41_12050 [Firmicutes bacterium]|nr:hypothetical protein [Bacillota bacterium]
MFIALATSCNPEEKYPKDISFIEYLLDESSCQCTNLPYDNKVIIINSNEELKEYISCTDENYPAIDFTKYSLIVLQPKNCNVDSKGEKLLLQQLSANKYLLSVDVTLSLTANATPLIISVLAPKISKTASVEMVINGNNLNTNPLIGSWREIYPDSCLGNSLFTFLYNDTLYIDSPFDNPISRVKWTYHFVCDDTIQIVRLEETNPDRRMTNNRIVN